VDGWCNSFLGPGVTILLGLGLVAVGLMIVLGRARKWTLLVGLWLALMSWLAAAFVRVVDVSLFDFSLSDQPGPRLWEVASIVATALLAVAVVRSPPGQVPVGLAWVGLACMVAFVLLGAATYSLEDAFPFAATALLISNALEHAVVAAGPVIGLEAARTTPRRPARLVPAVLTLVLGALLWGLSLLNLFST